MTGQSLKYEKGFHKESDVGQDLNRRQGAAEAKETPRCRQRATDSC